MLQINFGWKPDTPDERDFKFSSSMPKKALPKKVDLRSQQSPVYNQLSLGSCTANAICAQYDHKNFQSDGKFVKPSRLFLYYNERAMEGTINEDAGAYIRNGIKSAASTGICPEALYPYNVEIFSNKPSEECYIEAEKFQILSYERISNLLQLKQALADGHTVSFGFWVYDNFMSDSVAKTGMMKMPRRTDKMTGGHAVLAVGYDDKTRKVIVKNSWGTEWGDDGYFYMPYSYVKEGLTDDFWVIKIVE